MMSYSLDDNDVNANNDAPTSSIKRERKVVGLEKNSVSSPTSSKKSLLSNDMQLLTKWILHDDHKYHVNMLSPKIAYGMRIALIQWYRTNRRKLPWRGDCGPFDGSTVGYGAAAAKNGTKRKGEGKATTNKDIRSFFATSSSIPSSSKRAKTCDSKAATTKKQLEEEDSSHATASREVTAYGIWVSEIMLQQTRVEAVIPYWLKWMTSFPTVHDLALATAEQVNSHWAGLGFYRRARLLHTGAKRVVDDYNGIVPNTVDELMKIEGIGRYTASAIASMAYGVEVPVVDGNVLRVLSRLTGIANHIKAGVMKDDLGWILAEKIVKSRPSPGVDGNVDYETIGSPGEVNQALMELGATYCSPNGSGVDADDPLKEFYMSTQLGLAIGRVMCDGSAINRSHIEDLLTSKFASLGNKGSLCCRLCETNGVSTAFDGIIEQISNNSTTQSMTHQHRENVYAIAGHSTLPICPPTKSKREEVIAVAVMTSQIIGKGRCWLMVKRPSEGLLAGQWEFPSVCLWNSAEHSTGKKGKGKTDKPLTAIEVPLVDPKLRSSALNSFLSDAFKSSGHLTSVKVNTSVIMNKRKQLNESIVHIFSHVRHTQWIEHGVIKESVLSERWKLNDGREIGWMTQGDMLNVGITSAIRKILAVTK
jgi:A/G-specific adenine glycosylase